MMKILILAPRMLLTVTAAMILIGLAPQRSSAQYCPGSSLTYIVRDAKGVPINAGSDALRYQPFVTWKTREGVFVFEEMGAPRQIVDLNGKVTTLRTSSGACSFKDPVTLRLSLGGKSMNLTFLTSPLPDPRSADYVVDSLPFQQGTFEIELQVKPDSRGQFYPATGWKKVSDSAEAVPAPTYMFVRGHVLDALTHKPIQNASVSILSLLGMELKKQGTAATERSGLFEMQHLRSEYMSTAREVAVKVEHPDYAAAYILLYRTEKDQTGGKDEPFKSITDARIELTPLATVSGRMIDEATGGVPGDIEHLSVTFTYRKQGYLNGGIEVPSGEATAKLKPDGTFTLRTAVGNNDVSSVEPLRVVGDCGKCYYLAGDIRIDVPRAGKADLVFKLERRAK